MAGSNFHSYVTLSDRKNYLIDFSSTPSSDLPDTTIPENVDIAQKSPREDVTSPDKLCGFLNKYKIGARGLKNFKRRWFIYNDDCCKLLYYRTPQDLIPLGEIDISAATFSFDVDGGDSSSKANVFEISVGERVYQLEAQNQQTMMYWLLELQKKRRVDSQRRTKISRGKGPGMEASSSGFVAIDKKLSSSDHHEIPDFFDPVEKPTENVGMESATGTGGMKDVSFAHIRTELENFMVTRRNRRTSSASRHDASTSINFTDPPNTGDLISLDESPPPSPNNTMETQTVNNSSPPQNVRNSLMTREFNWQDLKRKFARTGVKSRTGSESAVSTGTSPSLTNNSCQRCLELSAQISHHQEELDVIQEQLEAHQELIRILEQQINICERESKTRSQYHALLTDEEQLNMLRTRDRKIVELEHLLATTLEEKEFVFARLRILDGEVTALCVQVQALQESIVAKDDMIVSLTNQLHQIDLESGKQRPVLDRGTNTSIKAAFNLKEAERLKDTVDAYKAQNKFLNKEIMELKKIQEDGDVREKAILDQRMEWEARFYQIQSKYLLCLEQLRKPKRGGDEDKNEELVQQLLEDAIETEADHHARDTSIRLSASDYDRYGFSVPKLRGPEDLVAKANNLQKQFDEIKTKDELREQSQAVKWENHMMFCGANGLVRSPELKALIRGGVPNDLREQVWSFCINSRIESYRKKLGSQYYHSLLEQLQRNTRHNPSAKQCNPLTFHNLRNMFQYVLESLAKPAAAGVGPASAGSLRDTKNNRIKNNQNTVQNDKNSWRNIELDLLRTLPHNKHYETLHSEGVPKLRRVLLAYNQHNPAIGYCQGLNRLVAIALLFLDEENAFWCLVTIIDKLFPPSYYSITLEAAQTDQRVLKELMADKLPRIHTHVESHNVDVTLFTFNWFLTIFVDNIPVETFLRIWDCFLYEGSKVLFRFALAFLKCHESQIIVQPDAISLHRYLRELGEQMTNIEHISQVAFHDMNPFPIRMIAAKRQLYLAQVQAELVELEKIRSQYRPSTEMSESDCFSEDEG